MGMYTEVNLTVRLREDTPSEVIQVLSYMVGASTDKPELPDHSFFACDRWAATLNCSSYYFVPFSTFELRFDGIANTFYIVGRADLKNYDDEIEHFIDWLTPYIDAEPGQMLGYSRYEECLRPTILLHPNTWIVMGGD